MQPRFFAAVFIGGSKVAQAKLGPRARGDPISLSRARTNDELTFVSEQSMRPPRAILASLHGHPGMRFSRSSIMNKDQVNGKLQDIGGKIQEEAGKLTGSTDQQAKGLANQVEGKTQEKLGDAKEVIKDATN
jgi:uncharacterized protein YjbJ (UPF0337 family)